MDKYLESLNEKQRKACMDTNGPSLIVAGAGSGKTKVLTSRIAYLISEVGINPENILAITFTNKAAKEMQDRIKKLIGRDSSNLTCKTFHSFCALFLRNEITVLNERNSYFQIIDDEEQESLVKDAIEHLGYESKFIKPKSVATDISLIKAKIRDLNSFNDFQREKIEAIMNEYNRNLIKNNLLDFDDLLALSLKILKEHKDILNRYQDQYRYILVDEFQDTSNTQYELIELLSSKYRNIFIVGDEDQSIYSFRGANIKNIRKFMARFSDHHEHVLDENYRSTKKILDCANKLIDNNKERIKKNLWTSSSKEGEVTLFSFDSDKAEARSIAKTIINKVNNNNYKYSDFAILYRNNFLSRNFENELMISRIPYRIYSGLSFYKRKEVKEMIAYLRLVINPNDFYSFKKVINSPKRGIGDTTISKIEEAYKDVDTLTEAIAKSDLYQQTKSTLVNFFNMIESLRSDFEKYTLKDFFYQVYTRSEYKNYIDEIDNEEERLSRNLNIQELMNAIGESESLGSIEETLTDFLQNVALLSEADIESKDDNHVSLITMHSAKGLEFRSVFVTCLEDEVIPGLHIESDEEVEEERRLLYVALTRAKEDLFISSSESRFKFGQMTSTRSSRFLKELGLERRTERDNANRTYLSSIEKHNITIQVGDLKVGERVYHEMYKEGTIKAQIEGFYIINFDNFSNPKKVIVNHPFLKKLEKEEN